jgi:hypothetical protein
MAPSIISALIDALMARVNMSNSQVPITSHINVHWKRSLDHCIVSEAPTIGIRVTTVEKWKAVISLNASFSDTVHISH